MLRKAMKTAGDALSVFHHMVVCNRLRSDVLQSSEL